MLFLTIRKIMSDNYDELNRQLRADADAKNLELNKKFAAFDALIGSELAPITLDPSFFVNMIKEAQTIGAEEWLQAGKEFAEATGHDPEMAELSHLRTTVPLAVARVEAVQKALMEFHRQHANLNSALDTIHAALQFAFMGENNATLQSKKRLDELESRAENKEAQE